VAARSVKVLVAQRHPMGLAAGNVTACIIRFRRADSRATTAKADNPCELVPAI
jgi:hypothetical protein